MLSSNKEKPSARQPQRCVLEVLWRGSATTPLRKHGCGSGASKRARFKAFHARVVMWIAPLAGYLRRKASVSCFGAFGELFEVLGSKCRWPVGTSPMPRASDLEV